MHSVLIDTNLLLLLVVGSCDKKLILSHKRTNVFVPEDFDLLVECIDGYDVLWVTSHCLAETSNLIRQTHKDKAQELMIHFSNWIANTKESHISKGIVFKDGIVTRIGITDTAIIIKSRHVDCVYTVDVELYLEISRRGYKAINFNHLRPEKYFAQKIG